MNKTVDTGNAEKFAAKVKRWASCASATSSKESVVDSSSLFQIADIICGQIEVINALRQDAQGYKRRADHFEERFYAVWKEVIALKSHETPVGYLNKFTGILRNLEQQPGAEKDPTVYAPVYLVSAKPSISKAKLCDWLEDEFDIPDSKRDVLATDFAKYCDCVVKDGD